MYVWAYPEMSIAMRFNMAKMQRIKNFLIPSPPKKWPQSYDKLLEIAQSILDRNQHK